MRTHYIPSYYRKSKRSSLFIVPWNPLSSAYPHLHKKFLFLNQFLPNSVDILFITYKRYSANFRKISVIVNELLRQGYTIYFNHYQCVCRTNPTSS